MESLSFAVAICGFGQDYATGAMVNVLPWAIPLTKPNTLETIFWTRPPRNRFVVSKFMT